MKPKINLLYFSIAGVFGSYLAKKVVCFVTDVFDHATLKTKRGKKEKGSPFEGVYAWLIVVF